MMAIVGDVWSYALTILVGFIAGLWLGTENGKRVAHIDGRFDELVRQAVEYSRAQSEKNTCVDMTREGETP